MMRQLLRQGSKSEDVKDLQSRLNARLKPNPGLTADGVFGQKTDAAVRGFQRQKGLNVDGIVGPRTWDALTSGTTVTPVQPNIRNDVVSAITGGAQRLRRFWFGGHLLKPEDVSKIASKVRTGLIGVYKAATPLPENAAAMYVGDNDWNTIFLSPNFSIGAEGKGVLLHEAVHATNDWVALSINSLDDEAMGHLAEAMYHIGLNQPLRTRLEKREPWTTTFRVADAIYASASARASSEDEKKLRNAIQAHGYGKKLVRYNGVF